MRRNTPATRRPVPAVGQSVRISTYTSRHCGQWVRVLSTEVNARGVWVTVQLPETQTHVACEATFSARDLTTPEEIEALLGNN